MAIWPRMDRSSSMRGVSPCRMVALYMAAAPGMAGPVTRVATANELPSLEPGRPWLVGDTMGSGGREAGSGSVARGGQLPVRGGAHDGPGTGAQDGGWPSGFEWLLEGFTSNDAGGQYRQGPARLQIATHAGRTGGLATQPDEDDRSGGVVHHWWDTQTQCERAAIRDRAEQQPGRVSVHVHVLPIDSRGWPQTFAGSGSHFFWRQGRLVGGRHVRDRFGRVQGCADLDR